MSVATVAEEHDGLSYGNPATTVEYQRFLFPVPPDTEAASKDMARTMSSCVLFARACWREAGLNGYCRQYGFDVLREAYQPHMGIVETWMYNLAKEQGALISADGIMDLVSFLERDDLVAIGNRGSAPVDPAEKAKWLAEWGGVLHYDVVVEKGAGELLVTAGGQTDGANGGRSTAIEEKTRKVENRGSAQKPIWWVGGRKLNYILRSNDIPLL